MTEKATHYLVDSSIYVFRAWFTMPEDLVDPEGNPVNALLGFSDFVYQLLSGEKPEHIAFAFDQSLSRNSVRNQIYPEYKANRDPAPPELKAQFEFCREFIRHLGIPEYASEAYEADDIVGALVHNAHQQQSNAIILTADKDLAQLLGPNDLWWDYARQTRMSPAGVEKKFGVRPDQIADLLAITGDKVDNIPGIPGVGIKTAANLLCKFQTLDGIIENLDDIPKMKFRGAARTASLVKEHLSVLELSRQLTPIFSEDALSEIHVGSKTHPDQGALMEFLEQRGFGQARCDRWQRLLN